MFLHRGIQKVRRFRGNKVLVLLSALAGVLAFASGCQNQKNVSIKAIDSGTNVSNSSDGSNNCSTTQSKVGSIYDHNASTALLFENRVVQFLSATMLPENIGSVSPYLGDSSGTKIDFTGTIALDSEGNVRAQQSKLSILIYDSIWYWNSLSNSAEEPITLEFDPSKSTPTSDPIEISGKFSSSSGQGYLLIKDKYGQIRFDGVYNSQSFYGEVSFVNLSNASGGSPASGSLGQFIVNSCAFVKK